MSTALNSITATTTTTTATTSTNTTTTCSSGWHQGVNPGSCYAFIPPSLPGFYLERGSKGVPNLRG